MRGSILARFASDARALDAFLLIHALASSSEPYDVRESAKSWAQLSGLLETNEISSGQQRWSRAIAKLKTFNLITTQPEGRGTRYTLLDESGDGTPYVRPKKVKDHGNWISPHAYWLDGWDQELSLPAKIMLLIALDQKQNFSLVAERVPSWYCVSRSTAQQGLRALEEAEILASTTSRIFDRSAENHYRTEKIYTTQGL